VDPYSEQAFAGYQGQVDQYGNLVNQYGPMAQNALNFAGQTGLQGMDQYMNPMWAQYQGGMDPVYDRMRQQAQMNAAQQASAAGAFGGSRSAILNSMMQGDVNMQMGQDYGQRRFDMGRDAAGMLMGERQRMGQYGMGLADLQYRGLQGQSDAYKNLAIGGDYRRDVLNQQNQADFANKANAAQMIMNTQGQNLKTVQEQREKGSVLGDLASMGMMGASLFTGGAAGAAGGLLGSLGGGASPAQQMISQSPIMQQGANVWNYGGRQPGL
jgi:hypothetical protein